MNSPLSFFLFNSLFPLFFLYYCSTSTKNLPSQHHCTTLHRNTTARLYCTSAALHTSQEQWEDQDRDRQPHGACSNGEIDGELQRDGAPVKTKERAFWFWWQGEVLADLLGEVVSSACCRAAGYGGGASQILRYCLPTATCLSRDAAVQARGSRVVEPRGRL